MTTLNEDTLTAVQKLSQVTLEKNPWLQSKKIPIIIVGVCVLVFILMIIMPSAHTPTANNKTITLNENYQNELNQNMAQLQQTTLATLAAAQKNVPLSKDYLARQNAPTTLYTAPESSSHATLASAASNTTANAAFAGQGSYINFANQSTNYSTVQATRIQNPESVVASGEFIHAVLETAINSDLPGLVRAVISEPVYAYVGEQPLIPAGSRLLGQYAAAVLQGMNRVFIIWNRIILPNGITIQLNSPSADSLGQAGLEADDVNTHFFARFGTAALLSVIGSGTATYDVGSQDAYNSAAMYRGAMAQSFQQSAGQSLQQTQSIKPTLRVYQGAVINVFVAHDLNFYAVLHGR